VPTLEALAKEHDIVAVVTQPDRPSGRGLVIHATPVMERGRALGLQVLAPLRLDAPFVQQIAALQAQLLATASYGKILPHSLLGIADMATLNVHPSLLPEYRGATPIQNALRDGRDRTGVTIFWMSPEMDAGDIALQRDVAIEPDDDYGRLHDRLANVGAEMSIEAVSLLERGKLPRIPQDHAKATFTRPIRKNDLRIPEGASSREIVNLVRSASPSPGAWMWYEHKRLKVLAARAEPPRASESKDGPLIASSDGFVRLLRVVPEGRREMSGAEFARSISPRK
jgi:methionyl-tRNA formyltransferase